MLKSTYQIASEITNVKEIKSILDFGFPSDEWTILASAILDFIADTSTNFKKDIAKRALDGSWMSEKQRWCLAYEFVALNKGNAMKVYEEEIERKLKQMAA